MKYAIELELPVGGEMNQVLTGSFNLRMRATTGPTRRQMWRG
jgi:hypothetical protein